MSDPRSPLITSPMSTEELATALTKVQQLARDRDQMKSAYDGEVAAHLRTKDRLTLVQNELEKAQDARDLFMRMAANYSALIGAIHDMSVKAKSAADAARKDGLLPGETQKERHETTILANRFAPQESSNDQL